jgi:apolipoprotein N-acyltransferase
MADAPTHARRRPLKRLLGFIFWLGLGAGAITAVWLGLGVPPQRQHGMLRAMPMFCSGVLALGLALLVTVVMLRRFEGRGLETVGLARDRSALGWPIGLVLGAVTPLLVTAGFIAAEHAHLGAAAPTPRRWPRSSPGSPSGWRTVATRARTPPDWCSPRSTGSCSPGS